MNTHHLKDRSRNQPQAESPLSEISLPARSGLSRMVEAAVVSLALLVGDSREASAQSATPAQRTDTSGLQTPPQTATTKAPHLQHRPLAQNLSESEFLFCKLEMSRFKHLYLSLLPPEPKNHTDPSVIIQEGNAPRSDALSERLATSVRIQLVAVREAFPDEAPAIRRLSQQINVWEKIVASLPAEAAQASKPETKQELLRRAATWQGRINDLKHGLHIKEDLKSYTHHYLSNSFDPHWTPHESESSSQRAEPQKRTQRPAGKPITAAREPRIAAGVANAVDWDVLQVIVEDRTRTPNSSSSALKKKVIESELKAAQLIRRNPGAEIICQGLTHDLFLDQHPSWTDIHPQEVEYTQRLFPEGIPATAAELSEAQATALFKAGAAQIMFNLGEIRTLRKSWPSDVQRDLSRTFHHAVAKVLRETVPPEQPAPSVSPSSETFFRINLPGALDAFLQEAAEHTSAEISSLQASRPTPVILISGPHNALPQAGIKPQAVDTAGQKSGSPSSWNIKRRDLRSSPQ